ncbi:type IV pilus modification protein PilV [bacterium SCSIO 12696]|nr:type IV pilus modification protein PilV [bacterium SCSIO 12696]
MIEVLISLFVLAIGLLGVLGMQAEGTKANQRGMFSTQAAFLAQSMADRIRVNDAPTAASTSSGRYDGTDTGGDPGTPAYSGGTDCGSSACGSAALLAFDQSQWEQELETQIPSGQGAIDWDNATQTYTVSVIWQVRTGDDGGDDNRADSINISQADCGAIDPPQGFACYRMEVRP